MTVRREQIAGSISIHLSTDQQWPYDSGEEFLDPPKGILQAMAVEHSILIEYVLGDVLDVAEENGVHELDDISLDGQPPRHFAKDQVLLASF